MRRILAAFALCLPLVVHAATVTLEVVTADVGATPNTSGAFTPATNDLLMVWATCPGTAVTTAQLTSSVGGFTFSQVTTAVRSSNDRTFLFVSDALVSSATSQTVDFAVATDECTGSIIVVEAVAGMTKDGADAIRQTAVTSEGSSGTAPAPSFASAALTGNVTLGAVSQSGLDTITPPTSWTESADQTLDDAVDSSFETVFRNSGFTGTTITWTENASSVFSAIIAELDTSAACAGAPTITDVDTDEIVTGAQTNVVITGTNFCAAQDDGFVQWRDAGAGPGTQTLAVDTWADTSIQVDVSYGSAGCGAGNFRVQNSADLNDDQAVTLDVTPVITDVDTDESITATQTNVVVTGTGFCAKVSAAAITIRDAAANSKTQTTDSWADTSIQFDTSGIGMGVVSGLKYGALDVRANNNDGTDDQAITATAPSGTKYADLASLVPLTWDDYGAPSRPYGSPLDLQATSQLALRNAVGCTIATDITINLDASLTVDVDCTAVDFDFSRDGLYVGTVATQSFTGIPVTFGGVDIPDRSYTVDNAISAFDSSAFFVAGDTALSSYAWRQFTTTTARTNANGAAVGVLVLTVDSVANFAVGDYVTCDSSVPSRIKYIDPFNLTLGLWEPITADDNDACDERNHGAGAVTGLSLAAGTGILTGTPTVIATTAETFVRTTDAAALNADSNDFAVDVHAVSALGQGRKRFGFGFRIH